MLNKFTAAAISTVLCLNAAIPCISECSAEQTEALYNSIASSAIESNKTADSPEAAESEASSPSVSADDEQETPSVTATDTEPAEEEPVEEGVLGDEISYRLYENGTLYIDGNGAMSVFSRSPFKSPESIKKVIMSNKEGTISTIGSSVFSNCTMLTEICLPDTLTSIDNNAFSNCSALSAVQFGETASAGEGKLVLSDSIEAIGDGAFAGCRSLREITVPEATETIGKSAFANCTALNNVVIKGENVMIGDSLFDRCTSLEELTLPFAGFDKVTADEDGSIAWLGFMFGSAVTAEGVDYTYGVYFNSYTRHIPNCLESITITGGKNIPSHAFDGFSSLKKVSLPDNIQSIGDASFRNCKALTEFDMPSKAAGIGDSAFENCEGISVDIPENVTKIGEKAFAGCTSIREINVPEATEIIGRSAFANCTSLNKAVIKAESPLIGEFMFERCTSLEELTLPFAGFDKVTVDEEGSVAWLGFLFGGAVTAEGVDYTYGAYFNGHNRHIPNCLESITITGGKNIPLHAFDGFSSLKKVSIPDNIQSIGDCSFRNCKALTEFEMPSEATAIGNSAFENCAGISVDIPENVTGIGERAFSGCTSIREINVPEATESIGRSAFADCTSLNKAVINGEKTLIGEFMFDGCASLEELTLPFAGFDPVNVDEDGSVAWLGFMFGGAVTAEGVDYTYGVYFNGYTRHIPNCLESITITGGKNIPSHAFDGFSSLKKVSIPDNIQSIGDCSFRNCNALTEFDMPSAATAIGNSAFENCAGISVDIPVNVTKIGEKAFAECTSITEITVPKATEIIGRSAFAGCTNLEKAAIYGGSTQIGEFIFDRCISLKELILPFPAYNEADANTEDNTAWLGFMFGGAVTAEGVDYTYGVYFNGYTRHIPNSLTDITFVDGEYVANHLLDGFKGVENVSLPDTVKGIGTGAFNGCDNLLSVYYDDTEEAWADVDVKEKNESIEDKMVFYVPGVLGDTNSDGIIDASDASNILALYAKYSTGLGSNPTKYEYSTSDINGDGSIDASDASTVLAYYAYISTNDDEISLEEFAKKQ